MILKYQRTGDHALLADALEALRFSAATTKGSKGQARMMCLNNLAQALRLTYERTGEEDALREADAAGREALTLTGRRFLRTHRPMLSSNLSLILRAEFELSGDVEYLREAVAASRDAAESTGRWRPNRPAYLNNFAIAQVTLFEQTGDENLLRGAVSALRTAIAGTRLRRGARAGMRSNLGMLLVTLFERTGDLAALREAVATDRAAVAGTPSGHAERAMRLNNLGLALDTLGTRIGDLDLFREAIGWFRNAADATASPLWRAMIGQNLAITLLHDYEYTGDLATLREAVAAGRAAASALPEHHAQRARFLGNLSLSLSSLAVRTGNVADLREAADLARAAVDATPPGHSDLSLRQANLGAIQRDLYEQTQDDATLDEAVAGAEAALAALPMEHTLRPTCLGNLGSALHERFRRNDDIDTLRRVVSVERDALLASAPEDPDRAIRLNNLGLSLLDWHEHTGDDTALKEARSVLAEATTTLTAPVTSRILAGSELARANTRAGDHQAALAAMDTVIALLPLAAPRALEGSDRRYRLATVVGAGAHAAACALAADQPVHAVELLEQARGLLMAEALGSRSELARLQARAPDLMAEFTRLRNELHALDTAPAQLQNTEPLSGDPYAAEHQRSERRQEATARWDELLRQIRTRPGLTDFLAPSSVSQLRQRAEPGPVVLLSAYEHRCDALILTADPARTVRHVPLGCTHTDIFEQATALLHARYDSYLARTYAEAEAAGREIHRVLAWLWDTITGPVLDELGYTCTPADGEWPRVWWCPVGMLTELPLHAAGHHDDVTVGAPEPRTVLDRVVSSYTATIRVLGYSRQRAADAAANAPGTAAASGRSAAALIVAMPETPGAAPLTGVDDEVRELQALMPGSMVLAGSDATCDSVLAALPTHPVAHFACHTVMPLTRREAGRLIVSGDADRPLTIAAISQLDLPGAAFAYLSACDTASQDMSDEATPITSAFQLAGYGSVIGTLWAVHDWIAKRVAVGVYTELTAGGARPPVTAAAASALHHTIRRLRADRPGNPVLWSGHVHTGI